MGQRANIGRNATLDEKKTRAAGRAHETGRSAPGDSRSRRDKSAGGAFGKQGHANRRGTPSGS
jgi:hypothetical protein